MDDSLLKRIGKKTNMLKGADRKLIKTDKDLQLEEINRKLDIILSEIKKPKFVVDDFEKLRFVGEGKEDLIYLNGVFTYEQLHDLGLEKFGQITRLKGDKLKAAFNDLSKKIAD